MWISHLWATIDLLTFLLYATSGPLASIFSLDFLTISAKALQDSFLFWPFSISAALNSHHILRGLLLFIFVALCSNVHLVRNVFLACKCYLVWKARFDLMTLLCYVFEWSNGYLQLIWLEKVFVFCWLILCLFVWLSLQRLFFGLG